MATYNYVARDALGKIVDGVSEAENEQVLVRRLRERGFYVQSVKLAKEQKEEAKASGGAAGVPTGLAGMFIRVKARDLAMFCRQFATMINAGVSLLRCLAVLEEQAASVSLQKVLRDIQGSVEAGESLSRSLGRWPRIFNNLFVGLVRAGEVGGVLEETLARLAQFLEDDLRLKRKIKAAMTYPTLVMIFAVGVVLGLVRFVLPNFITVFKDLDMMNRLPAPTLFLVGFSNLVTTRWWLMLLVVILVFFGFTQYKRTKVGKRHMDWLRLRIPVFGPLNHKIAMARFSRTLSTLLVSGVPILQAMETVAGTIDNEIICDAVMESRAAIREGETIGEPLERSGLFPPMVVQMISIGEETGALDQMLSKVAEFYEQEVDASLQSLAAALEPIMIVMLGGVVGFIVIAMFLPLVSIIQGLSEENED
jgi:type IV pilus assembly protein PilC